MVLLGFIFIYLCGYGKFSVLVYLKLLRVRLISAYMCSNREAYNFEPFVCAVKSLSIHFIALSLNWLNVLKHLFSFIDDGGVISLIKNCYRLLV